MVQISSEVEVNEKKNSVRFLKEMNRSYVAISIYILIVYKAIFSIQQSNL